MTQPLAQSPTPEIARDESSERLILPYNPADTEIDPDIVQAAIEDVEDIRREILDQIITQSPTPLPARTLPPVEERETPTEDLTPTSDIQIKDDAYPTPPLPKAAEKKSIFVTPGAPAVVDAKTNRVIGIIDLSGKAASGIDPDKNIPEYFWLQENIGSQVAAALDIEIPEFDREKRRAKTEPTPRPKPIEIDPADLDFTPELPSVDLNNMNPAERTKAAHRTPLQQLLYFDETGATYELLNAAPRLGKFIESLSTHLKPLKLSAQENRSVLRIGMKDLALRLLYLVKNDADLKTDFVTPFVRQNAIAVLGTPITAEEITSYLLTAFFKLEQGDQPDPDLFRHYQSYLETPVK